MADERFEHPAGTSDSAGPEIPDVAPRVPVGIAKPASASAWSSATKPAEAESAAQSAPRYSAQSQLVIQAIQEGLADSDCTQIDSYGPGKFSAQFRGEQRLLEGLAFSSYEEYIAWMKQMVDEADGVTTWAKIQSERSGTVNLSSGSRFTIILPPTAKANSATFSLRKHVAMKWQQVSFVENETMSPVMMEFLRACVAARVNTLFVGEMGSGKTTLLRSLASGFGDNEKVAVVEQVPELFINKPLVVEYTYQPNVEGLDLASVLDDQLYNGVDRLIVGEVHLAGITKMLETMIVSKGSMSTYHAFSTEQAGERMKLALQIENQNVTAQTALAFIKQAIELVVVLEVVSGKRRVVQITELDWRSSGGKDVLGGRDLFLYDRDANDGQGAFKTTGNPPDETGRIQLKRDKYRVPMQQSWFVDHERLERLTRIAAQRH